MADNTGERSDSVARTLDYQLREHGFESRGVMPNLGKVRPFYTVTSYLSYDYLTINCMDYFCADDHRALNAAWLNASQRSRNGVLLSRSVRE